MFKWRSPSSIRQKIVRGYYMILSIIILVTIIMLLNLNIIKKKVMAGQVITDFFDNILEMKRFEKNYFLYQQQEDYLKNLASVEKVRELLIKYRYSFRKFASQKYLSEFENYLSDYKHLINEYHALLRNEGKSEKLPGLERKIRMKGKKIVRLASRIAKEERKNMQKLLSLSQLALVFSMTLLVVLSMILARVLSQMVVKRLKVVEDMTKKIANGEFESACSIFSDTEIISLCNAFNRMIRELKLREKELIQSEKLAALGTLLSGVAHQLNNPLSNISSSCQILQEELEEADLAYKKQLLDQIEKQTDRARDIVHSLLEFSRKKEFSLQKLSLREIIEETVTLIQGEIPTKVTLTIDVPEGIFILADKQRIQQAFLNLIKNAVEAVSKRGRVMVIAKENNQNGTIDIEIRDTGVGIPPENISHIFDPFFTTKEVGKGTGLGLFVTHEIIEEHRGSIHVKSKVGEGTTFFIRLPQKL